MGKERRRFAMGATARLTFRFGREIRGFNFSAENPNAPQKSLHIFARSTHRPRGRRSLLLNLSLRPLLACFPHTYLASPCRDQAYGTGTGRSWHCTPDPLSPIGIGFIQPLRSSGAQRCPIFSSGFVPFGEQVLYYPFGGFLRTQECSSCCRLRRICESLASAKFNFFPFFRKASRTFLSLSFCDGLFITCNAFINLIPLKLPCACCLLEFPLALPISMEAAVDIVYERCCAVSTGSGLQRLIQGEWDLS